MRNIRKTLNNKQLTTGMHGVAIIVVNYYYSLSSILNMSTNNKKITIMASNKFDTSFTTIRVRDLKLSYTTDWGTTELTGDLRQLMNHLLTLKQ